MEAGFLGAAYLWIKAAHIIFVIFWMAGMLMLPRFLAYHVEDLAQHGRDSAVHRSWCDRERRLLRIIINPAMIITWLLGLALVANGNHWLEPWFIGKLAMVLLLSAFHGALAGWTKSLWRGTNRRSSRFFRMTNELPSLAVIIIVMLVILRPGG